MEAQRDRYRPPTPPGPWTLRGRNRHCRSSRSPRTPGKPPACLRRSNRGDTCCSTCWLNWCATWVCRTWCTWPGCSPPACTDDRRPSRPCRKTRRASSRRRQSCRRPAKILVFRILLLVSGYLSFGSLMTFYFYLLNMNRNICTLYTLKTLKTCLLLLCLKQFQRGKNSQIVQSLLMQDVELFERQCCVVKHKTGLFQGNSTQFIFSMEYKL